MNAKLSMENPDWMSPLAVIAAAHATMGGIDLDPASSAEANEDVKATAYFTEDDDGLYDGYGEARVIRAWNGRVFLNPPGGLVRQFWKHLLINYALGNTTEAIWVGYSLEQLHSLQAADYSQVMIPTSPLHYPMCVPDHRFKFRETVARRESRMAFERIAIANGTAKFKKPREKPASPTHGNYITYLGPNADKFVHEFSLMGVVRA